MTNYLTKNAQDRQFNYLMPILDEKIVAEYNSRHAQAEDLIEDILKSDAIVDYKKRRQQKYNFLVKNIEFYNSLDETEKEDFLKLTILSTKSSIEKYQKAPDVFKADFDLQTTNNIKMKARIIAEKEVGIVKSSWAIVDKVREELRARLSVMPYSAQEDIETKILSELDLNKYFTNK